MHAYLIYKRYPPGQATRTPPPPPAGMDVKGEIKKVCGVVRCGGCIMKSDFLDFLGGGMDYRLSLKYMEILSLWVPYHDISPWLNL